MKIFSTKIRFKTIILSVLILVLGFQSWTKADDISEFQIEGISVGDSLLKFTTSDYIKNNFGKWYDDEYHQLILNNNFLHYEDVIVSFKPTDKNFTIVSISGSINYGTKINKCYLEQDKVDTIFSEIFPNADRRVDILEKGSYGAENGDTNSKQIVYDFDGGTAVIDCLDWDQKFKPKFKDRILISIDNKEFRNWLTKNSS